MKNTQYINTDQNVLLFEKKGFKPLYLNIGVKQKDEMTFGGTVSGHVKNETYVCLSMLPTELQERVKTAIQALMSSF